MLRGRLTLVSVHLCFVFLLCLRPQSASRICTKETVRKVQYLIGKVSKLTWLDCRLYTPTIADYQKCPSSTIKCFAAEVNVLTEEWEDIPFKLNIKLEKLARSLNQTESECLQCELSKEKNAEQFLEDLCSTLKAMNFQHCSSKDIA